MYNKRGQPPLIRQDLRTSCPLILLFFIILFFAVPFSFLPVFG